MCEDKEVCAKNEGLHYLCLLNIILLFICVTLVSVASASAFYKIVGLHKNKVHLPLGGKAVPQYLHLSHHNLYYTGIPCPWLFPVPMLCCV